ncbi:MAG: PASTA domain-containing protein, partial [Thermus caldifontis]
MLLDDRYPVLETLEEREGTILYRVEGGVAFFFQVRTPEDKERFYRYRAAIKRLEELGLVEAVVSAKPGRYYAFFPERTLARKGPPRAALEALAPLGFGPEHLAMAEEGVAYLSPWPLGSARRALARAPSRLGPGFLLGVAPGLLLFLLGLWLLSQGVYRYFNPPEYAVPDLVGKTAREAFLLLKDTGLRLEVEEGNDPAKPKEVVLAQDPPPGTRLRAGRTVRL